MGGSPRAIRRVTRAYDREFVRALRAGEVYDKEEPILTAIWDENLELFHAIPTYKNVLRQNESFACSLSLTHTHTLALSHTHHSHTHTHTHSLTHTHTTVLTPCLRQNMEIITCWSIRQMSATMPEIDIAWPLPSHHM